MDVYTIFTLTTSGWLTVRSIPLLLSPRLAVALFDSPLKELSWAEDYLIQGYGLSLLAIAAVLLASLSNAAAIRADDKDAASESKNPGLQATQSVPLLYAITAFHGFSLVHAYGLWYTSSSTWSALLLEITLSGFLAIFGLLLLMFGDASGSRTKAKRSGWLFDPRGSRQSRKFLNKTKL